MEENIQITDKTALITGGASGLGKELAQVLININISVIVLDKIPLENINDDFKRQLKKYIVLDLSDLDAVKIAIEDYFMKGKIMVDILIINAFPRIFKNFQCFKDQEIIDFANSAFISQLILANYFKNKMIENNFGRIIIISSKSAIQGYSTGSLYCSLKAAWVTFHESVEKELKTCPKNISIITICPDSFSDQQGNRYPHYEKITRAVEKIVINAISRNGSGIYFPVIFWTKLTLSLKLFRKFLKLW
jgi:short-subunit dehydrogenase